MTIDELLEKYRGEEISERDKGAKFERLMKNFLFTRPEYRRKFSDVWLWNEFPFREELGGGDLGIDLVAKTADDEFWAVQCKFYFDTTPINKSAVDTFLATSSKTFDGDKKFSARLWISTTNNWNAEAERAILNQNPPVSRISLVDLQNAAVDWQKLDAGTFGEGGENHGESKPYQLSLKFEDLQGAIYARMIERVGNRRYWEQWAKDIAQIAERHQNKILQLVDKPEFKNFLADLR